MRQGLLLGLKFGDSSHCLGWRLRVPVFFLKTDKYLLGNSKIKPEDQWEKGEVAWSDRNAEEMLIANEIKSCAKQLIM